MSGRSIVSAFSTVYAWASANEMLAIAVVVRAHDRLAGARVAGECFPKVRAVFDVRGFIDVGRAAGGHAVVHGGEEAAAILLGEAVFRDRPCRR